MKTRSKITCASLALLIGGSSLLYITLTSVVKAESTQNVSSSLQTSTQIVLPLRKQCEMNCNLDTQEYSLKFLRG